MSAPRKPRLSDLDKEDRIPLAEALDSAIMLNDIIPGELTKRDGVPVPSKEDLATPGAAQTWAEQELLKATPRAVQEVIHQMRTSGDKKMRLDAAKYILERGGIQAKNNQSNSPVIILTPQVIQNLPWLRQADREGKIVDGQLVEGTIPNVKKDGP